jgi:hypothetical protein
MIILSLFELLYLLALHAGFMSGGSAGYNHGGHSAPTVGGVPHEHHTDYGHHTDMKIVHMSPTLLCNFDFGRTRSSPPR